MAQNENQLDIFADLNNSGQESQVGVESKSKNEVYSEASQYVTKVLSVDEFLENQSELPIRIVCINEADKESVMVAEFEEDTDKSVVRNVRSELESDFDAVFAQSLREDEMTFDVQQNIKAHETLLDKLSAKRKKNSSIDDELQSALEEANEEEYSESKLDDASRRRFKR